MIRKFLSIKNVGKFRSCSAAGDVDLRPLTLIYAENGRGKTTICEVLRSLRSGDGAYIQGRGTLGAGSGAPLVEIRLESSTAKFKDGIWSETAPEILIFDDTFVHENVYTGEFVRADEVPLEALGLSLPYTPPFYYELLSE